MPFVRHGFASFVVLVVVALQGGGTRAAAEPLTGDLSSVLLRSHNSGRCLNVAATAAGTGPCWPDERIAIDVLDNGDVMLRNPATGSCLYANADGRFRAWTCAVGIADQRWVLDGTGDRRTLRSVHANKCVVSNGDGRFLVAPCDPAAPDQWWWIRRSPDAELVKLRSLNSGRCLDLTDAGPTTTPCDRNAGLALKRVGNQLMLGRNGRCIYANADGRFGSYPCNDAYPDHRWELVASGSDARLLRSAHAGKCIVSNADGRFALFRCVPAYNDQHWQLLPPPPCSSGTLLDDGATCASATEIAPNAITNGMTVALWVDGAYTESRVGVGDRAFRSYGLAAWGAYLAPQQDRFEASDAKLMARDLFVVEVAEDGTSLRFRHKGSGKYLAAALRLYAADRGPANDLFLTWSRANNLVRAWVPGQDHRLSLPDLFPYNAHTVPPQLLWQPPPDEGAVPGHAFLKFFAVTTTPLVP